MSIYCEIVLRWTPQNLTENLEDETKINSAVSHFVDALRLATDSYFLKNINSHSKRQPSSRPNWADNEWQLRKGDFYRSLNKYKLNKSDFNRKNIVDARKRYYLKTRQLRTDFERQQTRKLLEAKTNNIKIYWKMLSRSTQYSKCLKILNSEYRDHFMRLGDPGDELFTADPT